MLKTFNKNIIDISIKCYRQHCQSSPARRGTRARGPADLASLCRAGYDLHTTNSAETSLEREMLIIHIHRHCVRIRSRLLRYSYLRDIFIGHSDLIRMKIGLFRSEEYLRHQDVIFYLTFSQNFLR